MGASPTWEITIQLQGWGIGFFETVETGAIAALSHPSVAAPTDTKPVPVWLVEIHRQTLTFQEPLPPPTTHKPILTTIFTSRVLPPEQ